MGQALGCDQNEQIDQYMADSKYQRQGYQGNSDYITYNQQEQNNEQNQFHKQKTESQNQNTQSLHSPNFGFLSQDVHHNQQTSQAQKGYLQTSQYMSSHQQQKEYIDRIALLEKIVEKAPKLQLKILSSASLKKDVVLFINAQGLHDGFRGQKDGNVYFGTQKQGAGTGEVNEQFNLQKQEVINDFVIPCIDKEMNEKHIGNHFQIYFDPTTFKYNIQDFGIGLGVFLQLTQQIILKDNYLFNIGHIFFVINLTVSEEENKICLKLHDQNGDKEQRDFSSKEQNIIQIGRGRNNDIFCEEDTLLSKNHCQIEYEPSNNQWLLTDNNSTNGTWIYLQEPLAIENNMVFKANQTIFKANTYE